MNLKLKDRRTDYLLIALMAACLVLIFLTAWAMAGEVTLAWEHPGQNITGYRVYQDGVKIAEPTEKTYKAGGLVEGQHYCWYVTAYNINTESLPSNTVCVIWRDTQVIELPEAPAQLILKFK